MIADKIELIRGIAMPNCHYFRWISCAFAIRRFLSVSAKCLSAPMFFHSDSFLFVTMIRLCVSERNITAL